ncbi:Uncharacterized protein FKW44_001368 [Caligus rogercresseyi]|uniref:Reverse transcriptase zinc-binding domain-containing protein n=1 Tax=Caligus rogercresseyi TaxID=217165 RepID=A0A7T8KIM6_CALRO|nr:Uncharacterized protein FKW44_001368 [Caligus rogercresseyi]
MVTCHIGLNRHLYKMGKAIIPICRLCEEEEETTYHLIFGCLPLRQKMMALEGEIGKQCLSLEDFIFLII